MRATDAEWQSAADVAGNTAYTLKLLVVIAIVLFCGAVKVFSGQGSAQFDQHMLQLVLLIAVYSCAAPAAYAPCSSHT